MSRPDAEIEKANLKEAVRQRYAEAAQGAGIGGCCGAAGGSSGAASVCDPISGGLYTPAEAGAVPEAALRASLGCGNPTQLADMRPGEMVLDLGSGGGIDVFLAARRVGPAGKVYGLDMTEEMLALARRNQRDSGLDNVEFLRGEIENIPLPDAAVDLVISNCVINLSADKPRVLAEAFRVLRPNGRLAISDVVVRGPVPAAVRRSLELWIGCIAGALGEEEYRAALAAAGFTAVEIQPTRVYRTEDAREFLTQAGLDATALASQIDGQVMSAFIRARKGDAA